MLISAAYYLRSDMPLGAKTNFPPESYRNAVPARLDVLDLGPSVPSRTRRAVLSVLSPAQVQLAVLPPATGFDGVQAARMLAMQGSKINLTWSKA